MNGEGQWLLLSATKTPTNHALDTKRRMWRLQMDATMPSLGQLGRYATEMVRGLGARLQRGVGAFRSVNGTTHPAPIARSMILLEHL